MTQPQEGYGYAEPEESPMLDLDSDERIPVCLLRNNGDEICEACQ